MTQEKLGLELLLSEKVSQITDLETRLHHKNKECIQLRAIKLKGEESETKRKDFARDLKDCLKNQDLKMNKFLDPVNFDLTALTKKITNLKKNNPDS